MNDAMRVINEAYHKVSGTNEEYIGFTISTNFRGGNTPNGIKDLIGVKGRKNIRFKTSDIDILVFDFRETKNPIIYDALVEHYIDIVIKLSRKYQDKASGMKIKSANGYMFEEDLIQEALVILDKCIYKYTNTRENSSFTSYYLGEVRNRLIEACRRDYFSAVKIPISVYKSYRRAVLNDEHDHMPANKMGLTQRVNTCISESLECVDYDLGSLDNIDDPFTRFFDDESEEKTFILDMLNRHLPRKEDSVIFCLVNGIFCDKVKSVDIAEMLNISKPAVSKRLKRIRKNLSAVPEIQALYKHYEDRNIFKKES